MVDIQSKEVIDKMSDELKIQPALALPRGLVNSIQPVYSVNPPKIVNIVKQISRSTTGSPTIFTTPSDRNFYLTSISFSATANSSADNTTYLVTAVPKNQSSSSTLLELRKTTLTAFNGNQFNNYPIPLLLEKGTAITMGSTFSAGTSVHSATITGYTTDPQ